MAQWIRPQILSHEVPCSNLLAAAVVLLGEGTLSSLPSPLERNQSHWSPGCLLISSLLSKWPGKINPTMQLYYTYSMETRIKGINSIPVERHKGDTAIDFVQHFIAPFWFLTV